MSAASGTGLRERQEELAELDRVLLAARGGRGGLVAVEGEAGIGKTSLLRTTRDRAEQADMRVLVGRGSELERDFAFSVVRQLFEPLLYGAAEAERARWLTGAAVLAGALFEHDGQEPDRDADQEPERDEEELRYRRRHGLYWLVANLAREAPLLIAVDDLQWADDPSLEFLRHLATRVTELPVVLLLASRPNAAGAVPLLADPAATVLRPAPLSLGAVAGWVSDYLGEAPEEPFAAACHRVTAGNPFLIGELLREVRAEGVRPDGAGVDRLRGLSPRGITTSVLLRLAGLPPEAMRLARAAAILGEAELSSIAALADLDAPAAARAAGMLARAGILEGADPVVFTHPVVRTVLYEDQPAAERALAHARAARTLHERGAGDDRLAAQLALAAPLGEAWALAALRRAAAAATRSGAPEIAARLLERALVEATGADDRCEVTLALGRAEVLAGRRRAARRLRDALDLARTPAQHAKAAIALGRVLRYAGRGGEAVTLLEEAERRLGAPEAALAALIRQELVATGTVSYQARRQVTGRMARWWSAVEQPPVRFFDRFLHAARAVDVACGGGPAGDAAALVEAALAGGIEGDHLGRHIGLMATYSYLVIDRLASADDVLRRLAAAAAARGGAQTLAVIVAQRALLATYRGHVDAAESDAVEALGLAADLDAPPAYLLTAAGALLWVAAERGEAPHPLAAGAGDDGDSFFGRHLVHHRAVLDRAQGRPGQAAAAWLALGERERSLGWEGPAQFPWRSEAALALAAAGELERARGLVDDEVGRARRAGNPRALGVALRAGARLRRGDERRRMLAAAVDALERSDAELERARALVDLGAVLRRDRQSGDAVREPLRRGHELAARCGATRLADRARQELLAAGARPRRVALSGRDALTPSELRVVELAARRATNREIAQALFVTEKTVETHLTHAYAKLQVRSRRQLATALAGDPTPTGTTG